MQRISKAPQYYVPSEGGKKSSPALSVTKQPVAVKPPPQLSPENQAFFQQLQAQFPSANHEALFDQIRSKENDAAKEAVRQRYRSPIEKSIDAQLEPLTGPIDVKTELRGVMAWHAIKKFF